MAFVHRKVSLVMVALVALVACSGGNEAASIGSAGTTTTSAAPTTTTIVETTTSSTVAASTTTTRRATTTTTRRTTTTRATTTTAAPVRVRCSGEHLVAEVRTDKSSYRRGEHVRASGTLRNKSGAPCLYSTYTLAERFEDLSGKAVRPVPTLVADAFRDVTFDVSTTLSGDSVWDQQICPESGACSQAPAGTYRARLIWGFAGAPIEASATFQLTG